MRPNKQYRKSLFLIVALAAVLFLAFCIVQSAVAATLTVTSTADDGSGGTLRSILASATDGDTIVFDVTTPAKIYLDSTNGPLQVTVDVTITGPRQDLLTIDGQGTTRIFVVGDPESSTDIVTASISGLTIANGASNEVSGGVTNWGGILTISDCTLSSNYAIMGGAIFNTGTLTLTGCTLSGNHAYMMGGAICNSEFSLGDVPYAGTLTLTDCTLSGNIAYYGGAINNGLPLLIGGGTLVMNGCTLSDNSASGEGEGMALGGAILNFVFGASSTITIENSTINNNTANTGGAIASLSISATDDEVSYPAQADVSIVNSTLSGNSALVNEAEEMFGNVSGGGAIFVLTIEGDPANAESTLTVDRCTLSGNSVEAEDDYPSYGGAINVNNMYGGTTTMNVMNSTLSNNSAQGIDAEGGAIFTIGWELGTTVTVKNSTLSGNSSFGIDEYSIGACGAIINVDGTLIVDNSTLSGNQDSFGVSGIGNFGVLNIKNTILANDLSDMNLWNPDEDTVTSYGYNLCSDDGSGLLTATGDMIITNPMLGPLADNGGPTFTHALLPDSPAIDAGDSTDSAGNPVTTDQRGVTRPQGSHNDIGAFEMNISALTISDVTVTPRNKKVITVTVMINNPGTTTAYDVTVTAAILNGSDTNSRLPFVYGAIKPGNSKLCTLQFKDVTPGEQPLTIEGTCSLGPFFTTQTVTVP